MHGMAPESKGQMHTMSRALRGLIHAFIWKRPWKDWPRPGRCHRCDKLAILTNETPALSAYDGAYLCEPCAISNDEDTRTAMEDYYGMCVGDYPMRHVSRDACKNE